MTVITSRRDKAKPFTVVRVDTPRVTPVLEATAEELACFAARCRELAALMGRTVAEIAQQSIEWVMQKLHEYRQRRSAESSGVLVRRGAGWDHEPLPALGTAL